jgi:hypothetical protein
MTKQIGEIRANSTKVGENEARYGFSAEEIDAVLEVVGERFASKVRDRKALTQDLSNDFMTFAAYRASGPNFSVLTRKAIDRLERAASKVRSLYEAALAEPGQRTWLMNNAFKVDDFAENKLVQIRAALRNLESIMIADDSFFRKFQPGMSYEVQFVGITLPATYEKHFRRRFGASHVNGKLDGPGIRFVSACLQCKQIINSDGRPFARGTIISHYKQARQLVQQSPELAMARAPVFISKPNVVAGGK